MSILLIEMLRNHPEHNQRLFWLDGISDEYLEKVYAASTCLIAASEGEGFGLPLIEAAQHKLPIIARDIPVFREVAGAHAHFFSGLTPADLANSIAEWLRLEQMGKAPYSDSMPWLTWQQSTQQLLDVILGEQWYQEWMPDDVHRYWGSDQRLGTQVGIRSGRNIEANGKAGYLLFGPYLALAAGQYQIALHGHFGVNGAQGALLDIASESGTLVVSTAPLVDTHKPLLNQPCIYLGTRH
ncbi:glycosyltransferase [Deefgea sp. CFH1-16]|uniref:glycosyltransferase n=1 Tax=Deefgea sp. CFH1-16 TaxID=2675457 RepID=UPI0019403549|nr:glycosyltransferase [Deefgea sp. CFH1-16]